MSSASTRTDSTCAEAGGSPSAIVVSLVDESARVVVARPAVTVVVAGTSESPSRFATIAKMPLTMATRTLPATVISAIRTPDLPSALKKPPCLRARAGRILPHLPPARLGTNQGKCRSNGRGLASAGPRLRSEPMPSDLELLGRLAVAAVLGGAIGAERELNDQAAGLRTHMLLTIGACLFTLISAYGFGQGIGTDPSRLAAQIVTGIGFLGGGGPSSGTG
jgi:hypothetical protein